MALILSAFGCLGFAAAGEVKTLEVVETSNAAGAEHLEMFLRDDSIAIGQIEKIGHGTVFKRNGHGDIIAAIASQIRECGGGQRLHGATHNGARPINEMTQ